jgi:intracellular septation protein A
MKTEKPENGLLNILINVLLPVLILNKLTDKLGPSNALVLALAFPLGYGIYDWFKRRKFNAISALGLMNVLVTGSLALLGLGGIWFAFKEAAFPLLIGIFVWFSAKTKTPFIKTLLLNPQLMHLDKIEARLNEKTNHSQFDFHLIHSTKLLATSFFLSAGLNFGLAMLIFTPLPEALTVDEKSVLLNQQIAQMTSWSFAVILLPSMLFLIYIFYHLMGGIHKLTDLTTEEIMRR